MNSEIDTIIQTINKHGFYCSNNLINKKDLENLRAMVRHKLKIIGKKNFWLNECRLKNTYVKNEEFDYKLREIAINLCKKLNFQDYQDHKLYKVLRVVAGKKQNKECHQYHFDAHNLTILIPIFIPKNKKNSENGDLIIFPNIRKNTKSVFINIIQKLFYQSFLSRNFFLKINFIKKILNFSRLSLEPGKAYIFYGFRTLHGTLGIDKNDIRATLPVHFYDPFKNSKLVKFNRYLMWKKRVYNLNKNFT